MPGHDTNEVVSWIDLTVPLSPSTPTSPYSSPPAFTPWTLEFPVGDESLTCAITNVSLNTHIGTHVDAPTHFVPDGRTVDQLTKQEMVGSVVVADVRRDQPYAIEPENIEASVGALKSGDRLFLYTGHSETFTTAELYYGPHSFVSPDCADWLIGVGIAMLGIDAPSPDPRPDGSTDALYTHRRLLGSDIPIVENLNAQLARLGGRRSFVVVVPLPIIGADGAPVTALALEESVSES